MHFTFYAGRTLCGRETSKLNGKFTGLDSQVTCGNCLIELGKVREIWPQASNKEDEYGAPVMMGGARTYQRSLY